MSQTSLPVLYSFRRCPYAMRARMALRYSGVRLHIEEVSLKAKPAAMLALSPKGTVPVLDLNNGSVLEESLDIMRWALSQHDPDDWRMADTPALQHAADALIQRNDGDFKRALDRYKYAVRFPEAPPEVYRSQGELFLAELEARLQQTRHLMRETLAMPDIAIFPFVRQFAAVDANWFAQAPYPALRQWYDGLAQSGLFQGIMEKPQAG